MTAFLSNPSSKKQFLLLLVDGIIVLSAFMFSYSFRVVVYEGAHISLLGERLTWLVGAAVLLHIMSFYVFELYDLEVRKSAAKMLLLIVFSVVVATGMLAILSYLTPQNKLGRIILVTHVPLTIVLILVWRKLFFAFFQEGKAINNLLVIGNSPLNKEILAVIEKSPIKHYKLADTIYDYKENPGAIYVNGSVGNKTICDMVREQDIGTIVVSQKLKGSPALRSELLNMKFAGVSIYDAPVFYRKLTGKIPVFYVKDASFLFHNQDEVFHPSYWRNMKRIMDILFATIGLILSAPLLLLTALAIKLTSSGPVFFKQDRLGANERPFSLIKFRTMVDDAEKETGPKWSSHKDPRITKVGKILRKTRIDEVPQLINVLNGDMSFVGPRPIRKYFADLLSRDIPFYRLRFSVKPGITGWAQVKHDYAGSEEGQMEKLQYELFYIQNQSLFFDMFIILKTVQTVLFRPGT